VLLYGFRQAGSYQAAQTGYAVTPATYTAQRTGYEAAYTPAATNTTPGTAYAASTYGGKLFFMDLWKV